MQTIPFTYQESCLVAPQVLAELVERLAPERERMARAEYGTHYAFCALGADSVLHERVCALVESKRDLGITMLIVVGIGGSHLGTLAVQQALGGLFYNQLNPAIKIYYADTLDACALQDLYSLMRTEYERGGAVLLNIVSKSGTTLETAVNAQLLIEVLKEQTGADFGNYLVVTTDAQSTLWQWAQGNSYSCLEIPAQVGGRFSVFSAVGLFPLMFLGIDVRGLLEGARHGLALSLTENWLHNPAALGAAILFHHFKVGKNIHDSFIFCTALEGYGKWYRQLMGESIGKEYDVHGSRVEVGITPTVSIGSTDLHSVAQLYLAGPHDKVTTFITVNNARSCDTVIESSNPWIAHLQGKTVGSIMNALALATQRAYHERKNPCMVFDVPEKNAFYCGQLMQIAMCQMVYLGFLLDINPFDQPNVELYKKEARKILAYE